MSLKVYAVLDHQGIPVANFVVEQLASDPTPSAGTKGQLWINTGSGLLKTHDGTTVYTIAGNAAFITSAMITNDTILDADINSAAGIVATKLDTASFNTKVQANKLNQLAAPDGSVSLNSQKITNLLDPTTAQDAATKNYVDTVMTGQDWKASARVATTAALPANTYSNGTSGVGATLTASSNAALTVDGVTVAVNDRVLVKNQVAGLQNGIYTVTATGSGAAPYVLTRATDADQAAEVTGGMTVAVNEGTALQDTVWLQTTNDAITIGTTALAFTQINSSGTAYSAGTGITLTGNTFSVTAPVTEALGGTNATTFAGARTNLNVPQQGAVISIGALTAGVELLTSHSLGTQNFAIQVRDATTRARVEIATRAASSTQFGVTADVAVSGSVLEAVLTPTA